MKAWVICDTDGGRIPPKPLWRHIYPTAESAKQAASYVGFDSKNYPIIEIKITIKEEA